MANEEYGTDITLTEEGMLGFDEILNTTEEEYHIAAIRTEEGIKPFYILNKNTTH